MPLERSTVEFIERLQKSAPVDVTGIAKVLGLNVWESSSLPEGIAGKLRRDDKNGGKRGYSIIVRSQDPVVRKRFTVAHELAHYLLHSHLFGTELIFGAQEELTALARIDLPQPETVRRSEECLW